MNYNTHISQGAGMTAPEPTLSNTVELFIETVNRCDLDGMRQLITEAHQLVTNDNLVIQGKYAVVDYWKTLFETLPGYCIWIKSCTNLANGRMLLVVTENSDIMIEGRVSVREVRLDGGCLTLWREYNSPFERIVRNS